MHPYDEFIQHELQSHLAAGETIRRTGFLFTKSLSLSVASHGLSLIGDGYFFAALTPARMFLIATEMGAASLKMMNKEVGAIPYVDIKSIKPTGFLIQKMISIELKEGKTLVFRLNTLAARYASGQKQFIQSLVDFHRTAKA